jgi:hypothetical protein
VAPAARDRACERHSSPAAAQLSAAAAPPYPQAFAGIVTVSVGHCHPEVVKAVNEQNQLLQHTTTIYLNNQIAEYAKELADRMPGNLKVRCLAACWGEASCRCCCRCPDRGPEEPALAAPDQQRANRQATALGPPLLSPTLPAACCLRRTSTLSTRAARPTTWP